MLDNLLVYIMFFTVAIVGVTVPFVAVSVVKYVKGIKVHLKSQEEKITSLGILVEQLKMKNRQPTPKFDEMEQKSRRLTERLEQLELRDQSQRQYDHAIKLVKRGSSIEEVMSVCGLNRGEAELIRVMHEMDQDFDSLSGNAV